MTAVSQALEGVRAEGNLVGGVDRQRRCRGDRQTGDADDAEQYRGEPCACSCCSEPSLFLCVVRAHVFPQFGRVSHAGPLPTDGRMVTYFT
ncbi:hypothetical protein [Demequina litorisediminis]|uniref:hypothetical protein n=1 Tax=Demequina litorisediminis TaxID=1849022 RepID=UPI0024E1093B|nr:hypothetical protein [Demequina litorisediminis]